MLFHPKHNRVSPREAGKMGRRADPGHSLLGRPELVPRNKEAVTSTTKEVLALKVVSLECDIRRNNPQSHEGYQANCLEAVITISVRNGIAEETVRKITGS